MPQPEPSEYTAQVQQLRDADRHRRQGILDEILRDATSVQTLRSSDLPLTPAQRTFLHHSRVQIGERLFDLMVQWLALGGRVVLETAERGERARPVVDPRLSAELRAEAPPRLVAELTRRPVAVPDEPVVEEPPVAEVPPVVQEVAPAPTIVEAPAPEPVPERPPEPAPEPVVVERRAPAPVASIEALASLKSRLESGASRFTAEPAHSDWMPRLVQVVTGLVPSGDNEIDLARIRVQIERIEDWTQFPHDIQRMLLGLCACRLRHLQDERGVMDRRLDSSFSTLTAYSARERPGAVRGLARFHRPTRETWAEDGEAWWERLQTVLPAEVEPTVAPNHQKLLENVERLAREIDLAPPAAAPAVRSQTIREMSLALKSGLPARHRQLIRIATPFVDLLTGPEFRTLRRAIREEIEAQRQDAEEDEKPTPIPADWPWWTKTRGRRALMIGGSPREPNRARLEQVFQFASLEWEGTEFRRNALLAVRQRVESGGLDVVIFLRSFVGHDADQIIIPACREHEVDWVHVEHGYGIARVKSAIERYLDP